MNESGKYEEGSGRGLTEALSQHWPGGIRENHERSQDGRTSGRDSNGEPPDYESRALPLSESV
jgi:hypothetical protein